MKGSAVFGLVILIKRKELVNEVEILRTLSGNGNEHLGFVILRKGEAEHSIICTLDFQEAEQAKGSTQRDPVIINT